MILCNRSGNAGFCGFSGDAMSGVKKKTLVMFGGKGGVGKSTCSAAVALQCALLGQRTIIITSDMTPSLSDIFEMNIGDTVKDVDENLRAVEIGQDTIMNSWKEKFGRDFYEILSHLIDVDGLDSESRHQLLDYIGSAPSLREETMLDLIVDMAEDGQYDRIIWDTAPSGETLNLIGMPRIIRNHLRAGAKVFEGLDKIGKQIIGKRSISEIMDEWIVASERISEFILHRSCFVIVANPERLVVNQVPRLMENLSSYHLDVSGMVINRIIERPDSVSLKELQSMQGHYVKQLVGLAGGLPVATVPLSMSEIKGKKVLLDIGATIMRNIGL